jgi:hypothetical protein
LKLSFRGTLFPLVHCTDAGGKLGLLHFAVQTPKKIGNPQGFVSHIAETGTLSAKRRYRMFARSRIRNRFTRAAATRQALLSNA